MDSAEQQRHSRWHNTACAPFEVKHFKPLGWRQTTVPLSHKHIKKLLSVGRGGGHWSSCTHIGLYGINIAPFFLQFLAFTLQPRTALEFGCGLGATADYLSRFAPVASGGADVTCIEPSTMTREIFGSRAGRPSQLAVNLLAASTPKEGYRRRKPPEREAQRAACATAVRERGFDLVYSLEVAEHIPAGPGLSRLRRLVAVLAASTRRLLIFSAARPGQGGTGHLKNSSLYPEQWMALFAEHRLVHMPLLTALARRTTYPTRACDVGQNVFVMRAANADVDDATLSRRGIDMLNASRLFPDEPSALAWTRPSGGPKCIWHGGGEAEWRSTYAKGFALQAATEAALWPELHSVQVGIQSGNYVCKGHCGHITAWSTACV